jgi:hypothetical protein
VRQFFASQMPSTELSKKQEAPPYVPSHPQDNPRENPMKMPVLCAEGS